MAQGVTPSGIAESNRQENTSNRKLHANVVDQILNSRTYPMRLLGMGKEFKGSLMDVTFDIEDADTGEFFSSLETFNSEAEDTTVTGSYGHTGFAQPVVDILLESMANVDSEGQSINLNDYKDSKAIAQAVTKYGTALYGLGTGKQPLGLRAIADDGTNVDSVAGLSRSTYAALQAYYSAVASGVLSFAVMATAVDSVEATGMQTESPNIGVTTKAVWNLWEQLVDPKVRIEYNQTGGNLLEFRGNSIQPAQNHAGGAGFTFLAFRGIPIIKDDGCPTGSLFFLNERYLHWAGRTTVPNQYKKFGLQRVSLGKAKSYEGTGAQLRPPSDVGWFVQPKQLMPDQAGLIGKYYIIGQLICTQFRRQGHLASITTI